MSFSPDNKLIATSSDDNIIFLWELNSKQPLYTLKGHVYKVYDIVFSPDGKQIVTTFVYGIITKMIFLQVLIKNRASQGKIEQVMALIEAHNEAPYIEISAGTWDSICWYGSLYGFAAQVMKACVKAVEIIPNYESYQDSRSVARALTGNIQGAIEDFHSFVGNSKISNTVFPNVP